MSITTTSFSPNTIIKSADVNTNFSNITTAIPWSSNPISAKGDLLAGTASSTAAALSIGTDGQVLTADSSQPSGLKWTSTASAPTSQGVATNLGLSAAVGSNALTITLTQSDGASVPTVGSPVILGFRSSTATTGGYTTVNTTATVLITVPNGASLGHQSSINQYVWVYALNNSGTVELAVSGVNIFDERSRQSSTTISGSATSGSVLYSTTGRSNVPIRLIGRILVNETSAGAWASAPSEVAIVSGTQPPTITDTTTYTSVITGASSNPVKGGTSRDSATWRRVGDSMELHWDYIQTSGGSIGSGQYFFALPSGYSIDTTKVSSVDSGEATVVGNCNWNFGSGRFTGFVSVHSTTTLSLWGLSDSAGVTSWSSTSGSFASTSGTISFRATVPILGWSAFGP